MKYLKIFESFNKESKFYWKISSSEFGENTEIFEFTDSEIKSIKSICDKRSTEMDLSGGSINLDSATGFRNLYNIKTRIDKEDDEYFAVAYNIDRTPEYYKADQMEGLIKLLEDIL